MQYGEICWNGMTRGYGWVLRNLLLDNISSSGSGLYIYSIGDEKMLDEQLNEIASIIKDSDLKEYTGDAFWNLIQAVISKDPVSAALTAKDVKQIVFHMPTAIFWNKMERFLYGTYKNFEDQVKMASRFNNDNKKYVEFVKKQIYLIDKLDDEMKVDCFAMLTRCLLLHEIELPLYFKLAQIINQCTPFELEYIRKTEIDEKQKNNAIVSSLYQYGLIEQASNETEVYYVFSGFGKALKGNCLNYGDNTKCEVVKTYNDVSPLSISEPALMGDIDQLFIEEVNT